MGSMDLGLGVLSGQYPAIRLNLISKCRGRLNVLLVLYKNSKLVTKATSFIYIYISD